MKYFLSCSLTITLFISSAVMAEVGSSGAKPVQNANPPIRCHGRILRTFEVNKIATSETIIVKSLYIGSDYFQLTYLRDGKETVRKFQTIEYMIPDKRISPQDGSLYKFVGTSSGSTEDRDRIEIRHLGKRLITHFVRSADITFMLDKERVFSTLTCPL